MGIKYYKEFDTKVQKLPESIRKEAADFIDFLIVKYQEKKTREKKFRFDWEGGLSNIKEKFTSLELQHKSSEWR